MSAEAGSQIRNRAARPALRQRPPALPRMQLGRGLARALVALRVLLALVTVLAVYSFIHGLTQSATAAAGAPTNLESN